MTVCTLNVFKHNVYSAPFQESITCIKNINWKPTMMRINS